MCLDVSSLVKVKNVVVIVVVKLKRQIRTSKQLQLKTNTLACLQPDLI